MLLTAQTRRDVLIITRFCSAKAANTSVMSYVYLQVKYPSNAFMRSLMFSTV